MGLLAGSTPTLAIRSLQYGVRVPPTHVTAASFGATLLAPHAWLSPITRRAAIRTRAFTQILTERLSDTTTASSTPPSPQTAHNVPAQQEAKPASVEAPRPEQTNAAPQDPPKPKRDWKEAVAAARLKKQAREHAKRADEHAAKLKEQEAFRAQLEANPIKALEAIGKTPKDLVAMLINPPEDPEAVSPEEQRLRAIEAKLAEDAKAKDDAEREYIDRNINGYKSQVAQLIKSASDRYDLVALEGEDEVEIVWDTVNTKFEEEGVLMTPEEALQLREEYLEHREKERASKSKKLAALRTPQGAPQGNEGKDDAGGGKTAGGTRGDIRPPVVRTLTNARTSGGVAPRESSWGGNDLSREAAIQRALEKAGIASR